MDLGQETSLALFPAKFQKSMWIKQGSFVVVDESGREKALESGCKVTCMVSQVLFYKQVRALQKSTEWTEIFKATFAKDSNGHLQRPTFQHEEGDWSSDDDGVPPLEANLNRIRLAKLHSDSESDVDNKGNVNTDCLPPFPPEDYSP
ncbi:hypothetical protein HHK36_016872 [Tetracentron sinense]|uniref:RNA-binding protein EIF1AD n=1 Tax=Tetracentron sinense TaxID=13715 RepID=A0A834Z3J5_TETSI|nr:hypothetical protein HHK36_016872 [Tetracentron sinense]